MAKKKAAPDPISAAPFAPHCVWTNRGTEPECGRQHGHLQPMGGGQYLCNEHLQAFMAREATGRMERATENRKTMALLASHGIKS